MTAPRAFVAAQILATASPGAVITLDAHEAHHIAGVLRLVQGDSVALFDGAGRLAEATVREAKRGEVTVTVHGVHLASPPLGPILELLVGTLKAQKLEWVAQKTTELGVDRLILVETVRSVPRPGPEASVRRHERLLRIVKEAARQSGRAYLPELFPAAPLELALVSPRRSDSPPQAPGPDEISKSSPSSDLCLLCWEEAPRDASFAALLGPAPTAERLRILVGPEGGLTMGEVSLAERHGFRQASLGSLILRAETAALATCALAAARIGRLG